MASPRTLSRICGALYVIVIALGLFGEAFVRDRVAAANIHSMEALWRAGIASEFVLLICGIVVNLILFVLLRPVNADLSLLALAFSLVSIAIEAAADLNLVNALYGDATFSIRAHAQGFGVALIFFGCFCVIGGYLIYLSGYFPKAIGVLLQIAGFCYLVNSFALILAPGVAHRIFPAILIPSFIGETSLALWLLFKGVKA